MAFESRLPDLLSIQMLESASQQNNSPNFSYFLRQCFLIGQSCYIRQTPDVLAPARFSW